MSRYSNFSAEHPFLTLETFRVRLEWYINIRWIAVLIILISAPVGRGMLHLTFNFTAILIIAALLLLANIIFTLLLRNIPFRNEFQEMAFAEIQILFDLIVISFLIHFAGGINNPFFFLYILLVILSGILFPGRVLPYFNAFFAAFLLTLWTIIELSGLVPSTHLGGSQPSGTPIVITSLLAFYFTNFAGIYIINTFMLNYASLKRMIDEKNLQLQNSMQQRNKLFRFTAHEIKSPVTTIKSTLGVVRKLYAKDLKTEVNNMIERAECRSDQILKTVKDMIDLTKYQSGNVVPEVEETDFGKWMYQQVCMHHSYAVDKQITLIMAPLHRKVVIPLDKSGMEKVLSNLVNNALRYTPKDGSVVVQPFVNDEGFGFSVRDSGIGMTNEERQHIFDEFYRSQKAREVERIGTGLGLSLVKQIVERQGGRVSVESEPNKGSVFTVTLPFSQTETAH